MAVHFPMPSNKLIFEKSSFSQAKKSYSRNVYRKPFNHSITVVMPDFDKVPEEVLSVIDREPYWLVQQLPLSLLIEREFIEAFIKRGDIYMLSHETHIDKDNCFALTPSGDLILNVDKDTYEELGIEGKSSTYNRKRKRKYVVTIKLNSKQFIPGKKNYQRMKWCLTDRLNLKADFLFYWKPHESSLCPSSLSSYFSSQGYICSLYSLRCRATKSSFTSRPKLCPDSAMETPDGCNYDDIWEWLGAQALSIDEGAADDYVNTLTCPSPTVPMEKCAVSTFSGLIMPHQVHALIDRCREELKLQKNSEDSIAAPWMAVTVHGFMDSPISWSDWEHGFLYNGDNLYTYVIFPNDEYWLYMSSGSHDTFS